MTQKTLTKRQHLLMMRATLVIGSPIWFLWGVWIILRELALTFLGLLQAWKKTVQEIWGILPPKGVE